MISEPCDCGCPGEQFDGHVCTDFSRFILVTGGEVVVGFNTWEEAEKAFSYGYHQKIMAPSHVLFDRKTNRSWLPGSIYSLDEAEGSY